MGRWVKGESGNPGGRPKGLANGVKQRYGRKAFDIIVDIMEGRIDELAYDKDGIRIRVAASVREVRESAKIVLAYTWGTPVSIGSDELERRIEELEERLKDSPTWPALEKRIKKLEKAAGGMPCNKPGHNDLFLFIMKHDGQPVDDEQQAKIDSIRTCPKCKDKLVIFFMIFGRETSEQVMAQQPTPGRIFDFVYGEQPEASPRVVPAAWLNGILTIGD